MCVCVKMCACTQIYQIPQSVHDTWYTRVYMVHQGVHDKWYPRVHMMCNGRHPYRMRVGACVGVRV